MPFELTPLVVALLVGSALIIGISKTSVGGMAALAVAAFATVMPAKQSTAAVLLLLIIGDIVAVRVYRKHADWAILKKLLPSVLPGIVLGTVFMRFVDDHVMTLAIGAMLLVMVAIQIFMRLRKPVPAKDKPDPALAIAAGVGAGFTTMTANAAGPVMALYLLAARIDKARFVGTNAWFFLIVNVSKVPFSAFLGLFPSSTLLLTVFLLPVVLIGTVIGRWLLARLGQQQFEWITVGAAALGSVSLLARGLL